MSHIFLLDTVGIECNTQRLKVMTNLCPEGAHCE